MVLAASAAIGPPHPQHYRWESLLSRRSCSTLRFYDPSLKIYVGIHKHSLSYVSKEKRGALSSQLRDTEIQIILLYTSIFLTASL